MIDIMSQYEKIKKIVFGVVIFFIIMIIYGFNRHTPLVADDLVLAIFVKDHKFFEIVEAFYNYYMYWGGRIIVHIISMIFLSVDKSIFNIANTAVYLIFNLLILFHGLGKKFFSPFALIFVNLALFLFTPAFGQDFLWLDGAANYLWGIVIVLAFFSIYRFQMMKDVNIFKNEKLSSAFVFIAGIIAGWTNENMSLALVSMILVCIFLNKRKYNRVFKWQIFGGAGAFIGSMLIILAPGNFNRLSQENGGQQVDVVKNFFDITSLFIDTEYLFYPLICTTILFIFLIKNMRLNDFLYFLPYFVGLLVSMYAMLGSPYYTDRAKLGSLVLILILIVYFYGMLKFYNITSQRAVCVLGFFFILMFYFEWSIANSDIKEYNKREKARIEQIIRERAEIDDIVVENNTPLSRYVAAYGLEELSKDKHYELNKIYADFYGAKSVRVK